MIEEFYSSMGRFEIFVFTLVFMILMHIISDFNLQTDFMSKFKQYKNWEPYNDSGKYTYDYQCVLFMHATSWSILTFFPLLLAYKDVLSYALIVVFNIFIHKYIDNLKANKMKINLIQDQIFHFIQIFIALGFVAIIH